jgi:hypothetical protein
MIIKPVYFDAVRDCKRNLKRLGTVPTLNKPSRPNWVAFTLDIAVGMALGALLFWSIAQ